MPFKLIIADDHEIVRIGLRAILTPKFLIIGEAASGKEALNLVTEQLPDIVLLDVRMPEGNGLECLTHIKLERPSLPVLMFSGSDSPTDLARAVALGAAGYLSKSASSEEIVTALTSVARGESIWTQDELRRVTGTLLQPNEGRKPEVPFTKREQEVLKLVALGLTNKEIAGALGISYETVKEHVQHILRKLGVSDRTQAAVWAVRNNLV